MSIEQPEIIKTTEIEVSSDLFEIGINPGDPCGCIMHRAITEQLGLKQDDVRVTLDHIRIGDKVYWITQDLEEWQLNAIDEYEESGDNSDTIPITIVVNEFEKQEQDLGLNMVYDGMIHILEIE